MAGIGKTFLSNVPNFQRPLSSRWGGGIGLNGPAIKRRTFFCGFPKFLPFLVFNSDPVIHVIKILFSGIIFSSEIEKKNINMLH